MLHLCIWQGPVRVGARCGRGGAQEAVCGRPSERVLQTPPPPREVLEWPYTVRGRGGALPLDPPSPDQSDHRGKKRNLPLGKSYRAFLYTNFWVPDPPPPLPVLPPPPSVTDTGFEGPPSPRGCKGPLGPMQVGAPCTGLALCP